jgi:hypothetical protein
MRPHASRLELDKLEAADEAAWAPTCKTARRLLKERLLVQAMAEI